MTAGSTIKNNRDKPLAGGQRTCRPMTEHPTSTAAAVAACSSNDAARARSAPSRRAIQNPSTLTAAAAVSDHA